MNRTGPGQVADWVLSGSSSIAAGPAAFGWIRDLAGSHPLEVVGPRRVLGPGCGAPARRSLIGCRSPAAPMAI
jgi:hypothetical protein